MESFTAAFREYPHDVIAVLESEECRAAAAAAEAMPTPLAVVATAEVGTVTEPARRTRDASTLAVSTPPVAQVVLKIEKARRNVRAKDKSCQASRAAVHTIDAAMGTWHGGMASRGVQAETFHDLEARMRQEFQASVTPQVERCCGGSRGG